jgi:hypothetical protein
MGGLVEWIQDYDDAFTELALLGQKTWSDDEIKKRRFVHNMQNIGLVDTVLEELVSDKPFIEACNFLRSQRLSDLISNMSKKLQDRFIMLASHPIRVRRTKSIKVLALIDEIQIQYSCSSDEDSVAVPPTKTAMVCKLAQIPPGIWMSITLKA